MKRSFFSWCCFFATSFLCLFSQNRYEVKIDLTQCNDDRLSVEVYTPKINKSEINFHLPKIVPGTYAVSNFGSFVLDFKAYDGKGNSLTVNHTDKNTWTICNAEKLHKVTYTVEDTWDTPQINEDVFEPSGTSFRKDTAFVLNTFGLIGYLEGNEKKAFRLAIKYPEGFYGATSLKSKKGNIPNLDVFETDSYQKLTDAPILYAKPDIAWLKVANTSVLVSVFSDDGKHTAKELVKDIRPILEAHAKYLGGELPVDKYAFLVYLSNKENITRFGALEHSQSCLTYLPEHFSSQELSTQFRDIASHEFLHIITPLTVHSEEIGNFEYIDTKMSKHLWLYEGITEYTTHLSQLRAGVITLEEYLKRQATKIRNAKNLFNDTLSFTELSLGALEKHKDEYQNVYEKGSLIGLCLDVKLLTLSNGKFGLRELVKRLSRKYGQNTSFKDDELFDEIAAMTYPDIRSFFSAHIESGMPLPLRETFEAIGINYNPKAPHKVVETSIGFDAGLAPDKKRLMIAGLSRLTNLGKRFGFQEGDIFVSMNNQPFTVETFQSRFTEYTNAAKVGYAVKFNVLRKDRDGKEVEVTLTADVREEMDTYILLEPIKPLSANQQRMREKWLGR